MRLEPLTHHKPDILASLPTMRVMQSHIGKGGDAVKTADGRWRANDPAYEADA